jgi:hypothetical protein
MNAKDVPVRVRDRTGEDEVRPAGRPIGAPVRITTGELEPRTPVELDRDETDGARGERNLVAIWRGAGEQPVRELALSAASIGVDRVDLGELLVVEDLRAVG